MTDVYEHNERHLNIGGLLKEAVFGFNDGVVSTFAVIAGLTGGSVENRTILLAALATLFAGAFSMGLGTYLGSKSEREMYESEKRREIYEMEHMPDLERQEIRDIYKKRGFEGPLLENVVEKITSNPRVWLSTMMVEELGFAEIPAEPMKNGITMSFAFIAGAIIPTAPYLIPSDDSSPLSAFFITSLSFSILGLLLAGGLKTKFTGKNMLTSAFETLLVGVVAAAGSYGIGMILT